MQLIYSFTVALFLTIALIPLLIRFSGQMQLLDSPDDDRKVHDRVIPRSGGLAIVLGVFLPLLFLLPIENEFKSLLWGAATIVVFGYLDDRFELDYKWKFLGQILAVIAVMYGGVLICEVPMMGYEDAPLWVSLPLTFLFLLGATNAVNLSDGLDGLAAGTSLLSLALIAAFALLQENSSIALVALTVIGGLLGFLRYNTFPARIFMGDTGSQFLGYIIACLAILVTQSDSSPLSPVLPLLILGLPILDTLTVMTIRIKEKRSPFSPDKNHLHHQLMSLGLKHYQAVGTIYLILVVLLISAYFFRYENDWFLLLFYSFYSGLIIAYLYIGCRKKVRNELRPAEENVRDRRNQLLRKMDLVYLHSSKIIEVIVSLIMLISAVLISNVRTDFAYASLLIVAGLVVLFFAKKMNRLVVARACCYTASVFVVYLFTTTAADQESRLVINSAFVTLVAFLMLSIRMTRREEFRLDTQDLLVLLLVLIVPQLPIKTLGSNDVGLISLQLAALMYSCEFILGKARTNFSILIISSMISLLIVGLPPLVTI